MDNNSLASKQKPTTICDKFLIVIRNTTPFLPIRLLNNPQRNHKNAASVRASPSSTNVHLMSSDRCAGVSKTETRKMDPKRCPQEKAGIVLPIHGNENRFPSSMGEIGHTKSEAAESLNRMFSEYINRTKHKFHSNGTDQPGKIASFKEGLGAKDRRLKK